MAKEIGSKNKLLKWLSNNSNYVYYTDEKYDNYFEKLRMKSLNCNDRDGNNYDRR